MISAKTCIPAFAALAALAGCFREVPPAEDSVRPETRVWLKDAGLSVVTARDVHEKGMIYFGEQGGWSNLSSRVSNFDPKSLEYLNLDYNAITNADALAEFTALKWLRLDNNAISSLPDLGGLKDLRRIYLRANRLTAVPETLGDLPSLDTVDLSFNHGITEVPEWFAKKEGLSHLILSSTGITRLPEDISAWKSLRTLQMGGLHIESTEEMKRIRDALPDTAVVF